MPMPELCVLLIEAGAAIPVQLNAIEMASEFAVLGTACRLEELERGVLTLSARCDRWD